MKTQTQFPQRTCKEDLLPFTVEESKSKLLPHIVGEYEFRITNQLLIQKIINPRRDKIIMDSLINASQKTTTVYGLRNNLTSKSIYHRRKKNQKKKMRLECKSSMSPVSLQNSVLYIQSSHQGDDRTKGVEKGKCEEEQKQQEHRVSFIGRIKRNNNTQSAFFKDNYLIQNKVKCGTIVHQSWMNAHSQMKIDNEERHLKRVRQRQFGRATHKENRIPVDSSELYQDRSQDIVE